MTRVLVIEDDSFLVDAYSTKLKKSGYHTILATNGMEGLLQAKKTKPDIILLDLLLPKKNGFDVLADLKADQKLKKIPVIVLSNLGQERDVEQVRQLGADDYLIKANVTMKAIVDKIEQIVQGEKGSFSSVKKVKKKLKKIKKIKKIKTDKPVKVKLKSHHKHHHKKKLQKEDLVDKKEKGLFKKIIKKIKKSKTKE